MAVAFAVGLACGMIAAPARATTARTGDVDRLHAADVLAPSATLHAALQRSRGWRTWSSQHPVWRTTWNERTRTLHRASGPGVRLDLRVPLTASNVEAASRAFLFGTAALTGVRAEELHLLHADFRLGRWYVVFEQRVDGLPVRGGRADVRLGAAGEVVLFGADWHRVPSAARVAALDVETALLAASDGLASTPAHLETRLVIAPEARGDSYAYHLAYELRFRTTEPVGRWLALVDARSGELLWRENQIRDADLNGRVTALVEPSTAGDLPEDSPLADTRVEVSGGPPASGFTDVDGHFHLTTVSTDSTDVVVRLAGRWARVYRGSLLGVTPSLVVRLRPGTSGTVQFTDLEATPGERDAYFHVGIAHRFLHDLDPAFTQLDHVMPIVVDLPNNECNAFFDGDGLNFYAQGSKCPGTARIADVVYHEYGHAVTYGIYGGITFTGAMNEGFSDYYAATIAGHPRLAPGFYGPDTFLRNLQNTLRWPADAEGEAHHDGRILGGALWDLRQVLGRAATDALFYFALYGRATSFEDYLFDVLVTDDDDANLDDGTPHLEAIAAAFDAHGIGDYSVQIVHDPEPDTEDLASAPRLSATLSSIYPLDAPSTRLHWAADDGPWHEQALVASGSSPRRVQTTLPPQSGGTSIAYYITAADVAGHTAMLPEDGAAAPFRFRIGADTTAPVIVHVPPGDRPVEAFGWPLQARVLDNLDHDVATVVLQYGSAPDLLDHSIAFASTPSHWWRAVVPRFDQSIGDSLFYRIVATDSAAGANTSTSPASGVHRAGIVRGFLRDFDGDDGELVPDGDWVRGLPSGEVARGAAGRVWSNAFDGAYSNGRRSDLVSPIYDLRSWRAASLSFRHWYSTESSNDGGDVEVTTDGGSHWFPLIPDGGYPTALQFLNSGGFSGDGRAWQPADFDLSRYVGRRIQLRWHFVADLWASAGGWFLDEVELTEKQLLCAPLDVAAESGLDARVALRWRAPPGLDPQRADTPLQGYSVYRGTSPDLGDAAPVATLPKTAIMFVDSGLVNGTTYRYAVAARYAAGESRRSSTVAGQPFLAHYAADATALEVSVADSAADTALAITNTGTGILKVNVWPADAGDASPDALRIAYDLGAPDVVLHGAADLGRTPDLKDLTVGWSDGALILALNAYRNWGDLLTDFNLDFGLDTDADRGTGDAGGADLHVVVGVYPRTYYSSIAVVLNDREGFVGLPLSSAFSNTQMSVAVAPQMLGSPQRVLVTVVARNRDLSTILDRVPEARAIGGWLQPGALHVAVPAGSTRRLDVALPGGVTPGHYEGTLFLDTNDPLAARVAIPVRYDFRSTPVQVFDVAVAQEQEDVVLRWRTARARDVAGYRVLRAAAGALPEPLHPDVAPTSDGAYAFRDARVPAGRFTYRIGELSPAGELTLQAAAEIEVTHVVPRHAFFDRNVPNPFNPSTTLRFGIATGGPAELVVHDARGRRVRSLWRSAHAEPGLYHLVWDGRDESGRRVASGVYHARLTTAGSTLVQRLTMIK